MLSIAGCPSYPGYFHTFSTSFWPCHGAFEIFSSPRCSTPLIEALGKRSLRRTEASWESTAQRYHGIIICMMDCGHFRFSLALESSWKSPKALDPFQNQSQRLFEWNVHQQIKQQNCFKAIDHTPKRIQKTVFKCGCPTFYGRTCNSQLGFVDFRADFSPGLSQWGGAFWAELCRLRSQESWASWVAAEWIKHGYRFIWMLQYYLHKVKKCVYIIDYTYILYIYIYIYIYILWLDIIVFFFF